MEEEEDAGNFLCHILDLTYEEVTPRECANAQLHMSRNERSQLQEGFEKHKIVFDDNFKFYLMRSFVLI